MTQQSQSQVQPKVSQKMKFEVARMTVEYNLKSAEKDIKTLLAAIKQTAERDLAVNIEVVHTSSLVNDSLALAEAVTKRDQLKVQLQALSFLEN